MFKHNIIVSFQSSFVAYSKNNGKEQYKSLGSCILIIKITNFTWQLLTIANRTKIELFGLRFTLWLVNMCRWLVWLNGPKCTCILIFQNITKILNFTKITNISYVTIDKLYCFWGLQLKAWKTNITCGIQLEFDLF
jgi:hypothetical protein